MRWLLVVTALWLLLGSSAAATGDLFSAVAANADADDAEAAQVCEVEVDGLSAATSTSASSSNSSATAEDEHWVRRLAMSLSNLPKSGLNNTDDCNNKMCYYLESALSCKALGFNISKICARYFLGYLYGCSAFPAPSELFNAPSTCLTEVLALIPASAKSGLSAAAAKAGGGGSKPTLDPSSLGGAGSNHTKAYLASNFTQNCRRTCFQRYITQANTFYNTCNYQLVQFANKTNQNSLYPLVFTLENYQEFKNQVCVQNDEGKNCYDSLASINPAVHPQKPGGINILSFQCNYLNDPTYNLMVLQGVCKTLGANGCCAANQIAMIAQAQTNSSATATYNTNMKSQAVRMMPPCLMHYLTSTACPSVDVGNFCSRGANGNLTTFSGTIQLNDARAANPKSKPLPNIYVEADVLFLQGVIGYGLPGSFSNPKTHASALQVEITDYAYFNDTVANQSPKTQITPPKNNYWPAGGDYALAKSALYKFRFVVQGLDQAASDALYTALTKDGNFAACAIKTGTYQLLDLLFGTGAKCTMDSSAASVVLADPLVLPPKNGAARGGLAGSGAGMLWALVGLVAVLLGHR